MAKSKGKSGKSKKQPAGPVMTPEALQAWRDRRELSRQALCRLLDINVSTLQRYERGGRYDTGTDMEIPKVFRLALAALAMGILDYDGEKNVGQPSFVTVLPKEG